MRQSQKEEPNANKVKRSAQKIEFIITILQQKATRRCQFECE